MILTHGANSLEIGSVDTVVIGGRAYPVVQIGNQLWIAENLDFKPDGMTGSTWYYDNDEDTYGIDGTYKCGLMYDRTAKDYLVNNTSTLFPAGWHIASSDEWSTLFTFLGGLTNASANKIKAVPGSITSNFPSSGWGGTDDFGFGLTPAGDMEGSFLYFNDRILLRTSDSSGFVCVYSNQDPSISDHYDYLGMYLRLVKDAP